jgi:hypothetical protein
VTRRRRRLPHPLIWIAGGLVVAGLVAWPLGGWNDAVLVSREVPTLPAGETVRTGQMDVTVDSMVATRIHPNGYQTADPGTQYLVVTLELLLQDTQPAYGFEGLVSIDGVVDLDPPSDVIPDSTLLLADDDVSFSTAINPGVPTRFAWVWLVDDAWVDAHPRVRTGFAERRKFKGTIVAGSYWVSEGYAAYQEIPLEIDDTPVPVDEEDPFA